MGLPEAVACHYTVLSKALKYKDEYTSLHSERVIGLSVAIGSELALSEKDMQMLTLAAMVHDVGKIGIPDRILLKPEALDSAEWAVMKKHSEIGAEIVQCLQFGDATKVASIVASHHEHFDGSGYPKGLRGDEIPLLSRIILVADCFDAIRQRRSYHEAKSLEETLEVMAPERGRLSDPDIFDVFLRIIHKSKWR